MPLSNEFQRKQQIQAKQFQRQEAGPIESPEDIMLVKNILVNVDEEIEEVIPYANAKQDLDPLSGSAHPINRIETNTYRHTWSTNDYFEIRWDGRPHRIKAGETRQMPRYLADHFAKYLIDFILTKREVDEKLKNLVGNKLEREKLYKQIVIKVTSYYNSDLYDFQTEGQYVENQVQSINAFDVGEVPNRAIGYANDKPIMKDTSRNMDISQIAGMSKDEALSMKTKKELAGEAEMLGIDLKGSETKEQIYDLITKF